MKRKWWCNSVGSTLIPSHVIIDIRSPRFKRSGLLWVRSIVAWHGSNADESGEMDHLNYLRLSIDNPLMRIKRTAQLFNSSASAFTRERRIFLEGLLWGRFSDGRSTRGRGEIRNKKEPHWHGFLRWRIRGDTGLSFRLRRRLKFCWWLRRNVIWPRLPRERVRWFR